MRSSTGAALSLAVVTGYLVLYHHSMLSPDELLAELRANHSNPFVVSRDLDVY